MIIININNQDEVGKWVSKLIDEDKLVDFYRSKYWIRLRKEILDEYKHECQECKKKGFYKRANHVHHVQFVRNHPRLALSKTYIFQGREYINLIPVCKECHETVCHPERLRHNKQEPLTEERW